MNIIKSWLKLVDQSIKPPKWYDRIVHLKVRIKKGQQFGRVIIPCAIETLSHSIDLNPSLLRKKDKKLIIHVDANEDYRFISDPKIKDYKIDKIAKKIWFNPQDYVLETSRIEKKKGIYISEVSRCDHCGRKEFVAEVQETRYKSCPSIGVKLSDPAQEDLVIPVAFGLSTIDATVRTINNLTPLIGAVLLGTLAYIYPIVMGNGWAIRYMSIWTHLAMVFLLVISAGPTWRAAALMNWWWDNRSNMDKVRTEPTWRKWMRGVFTI